MTTLADVLRLGDVHRGTSGPDIMLHRTHGSKLPVLLGFAGNDLMRGDGSAIVMIGGDGNDSMSAGAAFGPVSPPDFLPFGNDTEMFHFYYGGRGRDTIDAGSHSYVNGKGTGLGDSASMPQDADTFIFHREGPHDWDHWSRVSIVDLGLDKANLYSEDFTVSRIRGHYETRDGDGTGGRFHVDMVDIRGEKVADGGGGEWLRVNFDERTPLEFWDESGTTREKAADIHHILDDVFFL